MSLTTVKEIEQAVENLRPNELVEFAEWFRKQEESLGWDDQAAKTDLAAEFQAWEAASCVDLEKFERSLEVEG